MAGQLGLNTIPSARMDESGTARIGIGTVDPYIHGFIGFQLAEPFYVSLRQSGETSDILGDPDRLYPGVDFKLRLLEESRYLPDISLGVQSATGHKRMGGEYLVATKRYNDFKNHRRHRVGTVRQRRTYRQPVKGCPEPFWQTARCGRQQSRRTG